MSKTESPKNERPKEPPQETLYAAWSFVGGYSLSSFSRNRVSTERWVAEQFAPHNWQIVVLEVCPSSVPSPSETPATEQEPKAWAIFTDSGNVRLWSTKPECVIAYADANGLVVTPLYAQPVAVADVRAKVIEECAQVAENVGSPVGASDGFGTRVVGTSIDAARAIRALQQQAGR